MKYRIIRRAELVTTQWSGGTTTQLAIWPEEASYAARDFVWRASTATIGDRESDFTHLPDYSRVLMVLEGKVTLSHKGHHVFPGGSHSVILGRFGQTYFPGGWPTRSESPGAVTDFNLMLRKSERESDGYVEAVHIPVGESTALTVVPLPWTWTHNDVTYKKPVNPPEPPVWTRHSEVFYLYGGDAEATFPGGGTVSMQKGDVLIVHYDSTEDPGAEISLANTSPGDQATVIRAGIFYKQ